MTDHLGEHELCGSSKIDLNDATTRGYGFHLYSERLTMAIIEITRQQFESFEPQRHPMAGQIIKEQAWFASENSAVIGVLTLDAIDNDWGYIILGRDQEKLFRAIDFEVSLSSKGEAVDGLIAAMAELEQSGQTSFPQD